MEYAKQLAETGVDGLELNLYQVPLDFNKEAFEIEQKQIDIVRKIKEQLSLPLSVKLSSDYTNILNFVKQMDAVGVDGMVLFNAFYQPDIDINNESHKNGFSLSRRGEHRKSLRYTGILYGNIKADICGSRGLFKSAEVLKQILSGASSVQMVSAVYKYGFEHIKEVNREISEWIERKGYNSIGDFKGKLAEINIDASSLVYKRAQYVELLLSSETIFGDSY